MSELQNSQPTNAVSPAVGRLSLFSTKLAVAFLCAEHHHLSDGFVVVIGLKATVLFPLLNYDFAFAQTPCVPRYGNLRKHCDLF